jgi:predicted transcriptional regulator of viral defense system
MKQILGQMERQFFAYVQMRGLERVRTGELTGPLRISSRQEQKLFSRLARAGMIARVWRGLYLVPPRLPLGGKWSPSETLALKTLMDELQARYQICGPNASNRYGFDEQVPTRVYAYNNRLSGDRMIGSVALTLIKVANKRLGGTEAVKTEDGLTAVYSSRARTLVDAVYDWSRFNSLPRGYEWIRRELAVRRVSATELVDMTARYGDVGTIRRIGLLLEQEGVRTALLSRLGRRLRPSTSLIPWDPTRPKRGTVNRRWGVVVNEAA